MRTRLFVTFTIFSVRLSVNGEVMNVKISNVVGMVILKLLFPMLVCYIKLPRLIYTIDAYKLFEKEFMRDCYILKRWTRTTKCHINEETHDVAGTSSVLPSVWRLQMQKKHHKLLCSSDSNSAARKLCEDSFKSLKVAVQDQLCNHIIIYLCICVLLFSFYFS
ncbi:unnamed protein product [Cuscuta epithymum]|uniref:Uncharacterized protein n=1 Tax=Cuscuta epithymum TaxID=186058 RepID=A0AAV0F7A4_9ASTE|nr:unnamed protein product [Cuscuta epithymum]